MSVHGPTSVEILKKEGIDDPVLFEAIKAHNPKCGKKAKTKIEYALLAADPMSGFVKAVAQIYPDKKIASVKHKSVMKRFNEMRFAAGANRDYMEAIEFTGLSLDDLIDVALEEMGAIADTLGLSRGGRTNENHIGDSGGRDRLRIRSGAQTACKDGTQWRGHYGLFHL